MYTHINMSFIVYEITPKKKRHYRLKKASIHSMPRLFIIFLEGIKKVKSAHDNMRLCKVEYIYSNPFTAFYYYCKRKKEKKTKEESCMFIEEEK